MFWMTMRSYFQFVLAAAILALLLGGMLAAQDAPVPAEPPRAQDPAGQDEAAEARTAAELDTARRAIVVPLHGMIDDYRAGLLASRLDAAREMGAGVVIVELNTPGGLVTSGLAISRMLKRTTDLHVIIFVREMALSAGTMIAIAAHEIVMEPGSMIGAAAPIAMSPGGGAAELGAIERAKIEGPILTDFRESARMRNYDQLLVEAMVAIGREVYWVERDGQRRFVTREQLDALREQGWQPVEQAPFYGGLVDRADSLLTVDGEIAVMLGLASGVFRSVEELAEERGYEVIAVFEPTFGETVVAFLSGMYFRAILMTVLMFSLYMSFTTPGTGLPEAVAVTALGVLVGVPMLTGQAEWWEIMAIMIGLGLIAIEIFVLPGFGVAGISGILLVLFGLTMTFVPPEPPELPRIWPSLPGTWVALQQAMLAVFAALAASMLLMMWAAKYLPRSTRFGRLILTATAGGTEGGPILADIPAPFQEVVWPPAGATGVAVSDLRPFGSAEFHDDLIDDTRTVDVYSDSGFIRRGAQVKVQRVQGSRVIVKAVV
jgi:membrane-bound serine protease (ClpP class)